MRINCEKLVSKTVTGFTESIQDKKKRNLEKLQDQITLQNSCI